MVYEKKRVVFAEQPQVMGIQQKFYQQDYSLPPNNEIVEEDAHEDDD